MMKSTWQKRPRWQHLVPMLAIVFVGCAPESAPEPKAGPIPSSAPHRVFLVTIDTLRADHLGFMGYPRDVSPTLDRLAAEGAVFTRALASSSTTIACHASLFTSLEPPQHRMIKNGVEMHDSLYTMAEMFRAQGYETAGFSTVGFMETVARGFDFFSTERKYQPAEQVVRKAIKWLQGRSPSERLFVWVHLFDVHEWYKPQNLSEERLEAIRQVPPHGDELARYLRQEHGVVTDTFGSEAQMLEIIDRYDAQILGVDGAIRRLYGFSRAEGLNDQRALWIVTSDHGEGLGSHRFKGHGGRIYNEQIHVPLIFHRPGGRYSGRVFDSLARHVDILPTLAEMIGGSFDRQTIPTVGHSLLPWLENGETPQIRYAFAQRREADARRISQGWEAGDVFSLQSLDYKYIYHAQSEDELYDLRTDPLESDNLVGTGNDVEERMRSFALRLQGSLSEQGAALGQGDINPKYIEELKALGYL